MLKLALFVFVFQLWFFSQWELFVFDLKINWWCPLIIFLISSIVHYMKQNLHFEEHVPHFVAAPFFQDRA